MFRLPCEFSHRSHVVACQQGSTQWCRCGLEKVDTQHHKHFPARPQEVGHQPATTSVCYLSHFAPQEQKRLPATKKVTSNQAGNYKEKPPGFQSIGRKELGEPMSELQATNAEEQHVSCLKNQWGRQFRSHRFQAGAGKIRGKEHSWRK